MNGNRFVGQEIFTNALTCLNVEKPTNTLVIGPPGSGKTLAALLSLVEQDLMERERKVLIYLFKEDDPFVKSVERAAKRQGRRVKVVTTNPRLPSWIYNPLMQRHIEEMSPVERMQLIAQAIGITSGTSDAQDFWAANGVEFSRLVFGQQPHRSFAEALKFVESQKGRETLNMTDRRRDNMSHGFINLNQVAQAALFNATPELVPPSAWAARVTHESMCKDLDEVVIFVNSSFIQETTGQLLIHFALISHMAAIEMTPGALPTSIYIDEFHVALRKPLVGLLERGRFRNVSFTLACQALSQLRTGGSDWTDTIKVLTHAKIFLPPYQDKPTTDTLAHISGEMTRIFYGKDGEGRILERQDLVPRLGIEELSAIARTPNAAIVIQRPGRGLAYHKTPVACRMPFPVSWEEHLATLNDPWPGTGDEGTVLAADIKEPPPPPTPTIEQRKRDMPGGGMFADEPPPVESPEPKRSRARADKSHNRPKRPKS